MLVPATPVAEGNCIYMTAAELRCCCCSEAYDLQANSVTVIDEVLDTCHRVLMYVVE